MNSNWHHAGQRDMANGGPWPSPSSYLEDLDNQVTGYATVAPAGFFSEQIQEEAVTPLDIRS